MALRLKISVEDNYTHRFDGWFEVRDELAALGWAIGYDLEVYDFEMVQSQMLPTRLATCGGKFTSPLIIYERSGSGSIHPPRLRRYIQDPMVLGYAKETGFRDKATYNMPHLDGRFHHTLISDQPGELPQPYLSDEALEKVETIFQIYAHRARYENIRFRQTAKLRKRTTDVFFSGVTNYDVDLITRHRHLCCEELGKLWNYNVLLGIGRCLNSDNYPDVLGDSKILVSPYGYGEYSWKDFEGIYSGCVVVKPKSDFVTTHGFDIYEKGAYCITCEPDFSDLGDIVRTVMDDLPRWTDFSRAAQQKLEQAAREKEQRARDIAGFLNRCAARTP